MSETAERGGILKGIRILELGTMVAGPVAATLLADLGAEVIKIEPPVGGDPIRSSGPFCEGESLYWHVEGRSKRSVTLDLRTAEGQDILRRLVKHADVLVENFRPGTMARWGCSFETLKEINPQLVMLSVSGFGQTGPMASRPAYDRVSLAFAGYLNMTGYPEQPPVRPGTALADYQSALFGAFSIMVALYHRDARQGTGQQIDISLFETIFRFTDVMITAFDKLGIDRKRAGNRHFAASPGDHYLTSDGRYVAMTVAATNVFERLCTAIGRPELADDPRFKTHIDRVNNYDTINSIVVDWMRAHSAQDSMKLMETHGIPHSLIYTAEDILEDQQYAARQAIATVHHPRIGDLKMPASLPRFSAVATPEIMHAPDLGEDTEDVLRTILHMTDAEIGALKTAKAI